MVLMAWFGIGLCCGVACVVLSPTWRGTVAAACLVVAFILAVNYAHA